MTDRHVSVALPLPIASTYTYRVPSELRDRAVRGARVVVPVRRRELIGIVTGDADAPSVEARDVLAAPDGEPALPDGLLGTLEWIAGYYGAPIGLTLKSALPAGLWGASQVVATVLDPTRAGAGAGAELVEWLEKREGSGAVATAARALKRPLWDVVARLERAGAIALRVESPDTDAERLTERVVVLADERPTLVERARSFGRRKRQRELFETLEALGGSASARHLREQLGFGDAIVRALVASGHARVELADRLRDPFAGTAAVPPPETLTDAQRDALAAIERLGPGEGALLFGVTGSGKTLVYLETVRRALAAGGGAIVLVPEIGLTPQTVARLRGAFGDQVAVLHSALSDGERADAWRMLRRGERRVAVGARSAVFAPVAALGVIVVDEEHEASYKNGETPRYGTREVAAVRARLEGARLVLGSATPSLETIARVPGRLTMLRLPERVGARPMPPVELVDLRVAPKAEGTGPITWSAALDDAIVTALARREQALLLLNRRGFAAYLQCPDCGEVWNCPHCSISLTVHQAPPSLRCHYCGHEQPMPYTCSKCASPTHAMRGVGTQQLEAMLAERYPEARLARMDLDTTSTKWSHQRILGAVERGEVDLLLGTQMIAKGLDFPNVTLVGVVDADTGLHLPDFRAAERTFQLLAQVSGRAGRGPKGGRVLVQTRNPEHHALRRAAAHDADGFIADELAIRSSPPYPPHTALVNFVVSGTVEGAVSSAAARLADRCHALVARAGLGLAVLGPAPCPLSRLKDRWRWHVLLKGDAREIGRVVRYLAPRLPRGREVRIIADRDPVSLL
jgi:primosomal protein N' (replication factor Y)